MGRFRDGHIGVHTLSGDEMNSIATVRLYEIREEIEALGRKALDEDGVLSDEDCTFLDKVQMEFESKTENVAIFVRMIQAEADVISSEMERLKRHRDARNTLARNLKSYIKQQFKLLGISKIKTPVYNIRVQKNSRPSVEYCGHDPVAFDDVPAAFVRTRYELDKKAILEAYGSGLTIGFSEYVTVETGTHLRID